MKKEVRYGLLMLVFAMLACSPVIAISWNEFLIIGVVFAVLLGPPLYRLIKKIDKHLNKK